MNKCFYDKTAETPAGVVIETPHGRRVKAVESYVDCEGCVMDRFSDANARKDVVRQYGVDCASCVCHANQRKDRKNVVFVDADTGSESEKKERKNMKKIVMKESVLERVWHFLFGYRYWAVVSVRKGTMEIGLHTNILSSRSEARRLLADVESYRELEVVSFWSRERYVAEEVDGRRVNYVM